MNFLQVLACILLIGTLQEEIAVSCAPLSETDQDYSPGEGDSFRIWPMENQEEGEGKRHIRNKVFLYVHTSHINLTLLASDTESADISEEVLRSSRSRFPSQDGSFASQFYERSRCKPNSAGIVKCKNKKWKTYL